MEFWGFLMDSKGHPERQALFSQEDIKSLLKKTSAEWSVMKGLFWPGLAAKENKPLHFRK